MSEVGTAAPWRGYERGERGYRRIVLALFAAGFATFTQIFGAQAVLLQLGDDLGISASSAALTVSFTTIGVAVSVLPWASIADRLGRTTAMRISISAAAVLGFVTPLMPTFELILLARFVLGLSLGALPAVAMAYLAEEVSRKWLSVAAGTFIAGNILGGVLARLIAGVIADLSGWRVGIIVVSGLGALAAAAFVVSAPKALGYLRSAHGGHSMSARLQYIFRHPQVLALYVQGFFIMGLFSAIYNYLGFHIVRDPLNLPVSFVSLLFLAYLAAMVSSRLAGSLVLRFEPLHIILSGLGTMVIGSAMMLSPVLPIVIVGLVVFTFGCFTAQPVASMLTGQIPEIGRSQATALFQIAWLGGSAVLGWSLGLVFESVGWTSTIALVIVLVCVSAVVAVFGLGVLAKYRPTPPIAAIDGLVLNAKVVDTDSA